jgi:4-hydroxy-4-methyl-2-oxoglutarate aldolase
MSRARQAEQGSVLERVRDRLGTGVVTDALTRLSLDGWMDGVLPMRPDARVVGPAATVRCAPRRGTDALGKTMYELIRGYRPGDVLVIEANGARSSVFGGNIARCGEVQGLAAMITDGRCRDWGESSALRMAVFCRGATVRLPVDLEIVAVDVPVSCGNAQVRPGDLIVADVDGVVVVPQSRIEAVMYEVEQLLDLERELARIIESVGPIADIEAVLRRKRARRAQG